MMLPPTQLNRSTSKSLHLQLFDWTLDEWMISTLNCLENSLDSSVQHKSCVMTSLHFSPRFPSSLTSAPKRTSQATASLRVYFGWLWWQNRLASPHRVEMISQNSCLGKFLGIMSWRSGNWNCSFPLDERSIRALFTSVSDSLVLQRLQIKSLSAVKMNATDCRSFSECGWNTAYMLMFYFWVDYHVI